MAQSSLLCANLALRLLGSRAVLTSLSDTSAEGLACNANIDDCKRTLLRMYPWNFAIKRAIKSFTELTVTALSPAGSTTVVTISGAADHLLTAGDYVFFYTSGGGVTGLDGALEVTTDDGATQFRVDLLYTDITGDAVTLGTTCWRSNASQWKYLLTPPSSLIRILDVTDGNGNGVDYAVEAGGIATNETEVVVKYIYDVSDYTLMDPMFYQCLAHYLAYNLCDHITASDAKKNDLHAYLYGTEGRKGILPSSRFSDATEDPPSEIQANDWVGARFSADVTSL
jgi:hypothetical protein